MLYIILAVIFSPSLCHCRRWAAQSSKIANNQHLPLRNNDDRSLPPWPQHRTTPIKRSYSNLPMDLRTADIADLKSAKCRQCRLGVGISRLGVGNFTRGLSIYFWRERDLPVVTIYDICCRRLWQQRKCFAAWGANTDVVYVGTNKYFPRRSQLSHICGKDNDAHPPYTLSYHLVNR